jgi:hypothetical protein
MPLHAITVLVDVTPYTIVYALQWRRQLGKFNDSKIGQLFWVAALVYSIYTGFFWTLVFSFLRIVFLVRLLEAIRVVSCATLHSSTYATLTKVAFVPGELAAASAADLLHAPVQQPGQHALRW